MSSRFLTNLGVLMGGVLLVLFALVQVATGWLELGFGCASLVLALTGFALRGRGAAQRWLDALMAVIAAWSIVSSRAFAGPALRWVAVGDGITLVGLALLALVVREVQLARRLADAGGWLRAGAPISRVEPAAGAEHAPGQREAA